MIYETVANVSWIAGPGRRQWQIYLEWPGLSRVSGKNIMDGRVWWQTVADAYRMVYHGWLAGLVARLW